MPDDEERREAGWLPPSDRDYTPPGEAGDVWPRQEELGRSESTAGSGGGDARAEPGSGWAPPGGEQAGAPQPAWQAGWAPQSHAKATTSLALGIVGLLICPLVCSVLALILGYQSRAEIDAAPGRYANRGNATAGIILGWIGVALVIAGLALYLIGEQVIDDALV